MCLLLLAKRGQGWSICPRRWGGRGSRQCPHCQTPSACSAAPPGTSQRAPETGLRLWNSTDNTHTFEMPLVFVQETKTKQLREFDQCPLTKTLTKPLYYIDNRASLFQFTIYLHINTIKQWHQPWDTWGWHKRNFDVHPSLKSWKTREWISSYLWEADNAVLQMRVGQASTVCLCGNR